MISNVQSFGDIPNVLETDGHGELVGLFECFSAYECDSAVWIGGACVMCWCTCWDRES